MSTNRINPKAGYVLPNRLPKSPNGRPLCRFCHEEVPKPRRTFCSEACVTEWRIRTDPQYVRQLLFKQDKGVCTLCGLDTEALQKQAHLLDSHRPYDRNIGYTGLSERGAFCQSYGMPDDTGGTWWHADHIVPVVEGGGECGLDNFRTLCIPCHKKVTKELHGRLAKARKEARQVEEPQQQLTMEFVA